MPGRSQTQSKRVACAHEQQPTSSLSLCALTMVLTLPHNVSLRLHTRAADSRPGEGLFLASSSADKGTRQLGKGRSATAPFRSLHLDVCCHQTPTCARRVSGSVEELTPGDASVLLGTCEEFRVESVRTAAGGKVRAGQPGEIQVAAMQGGGHAFGGLGRLTCPPSQAMADEDAAAGPSDGAGVGGSVFKPLMIFSGCPLPLGCALLLTGARGEDLDRVKAAAEQCVYAAFRCAGWVRIGRASRPFPPPAHFFKKKSAPSKQAATRGRVPGGPGPGVAASGARGACHPSRSPGGPPAPDQLLGGGLGARQGRPMSGALPSDGAGPPGATDLDPVHVAAAHSPR